MLSRLCYLYAGTTPNYWLDEQTLEEWQMYLAYGEEMDLMRAQISARLTVGSYLSAMTGKRLPELHDKPLILTGESQAPDRQKLREMLKFRDGRATR